MEVILLYCRCKLPNTNTTGFRGVRLKRGSGRFEANICINDKSKYLGTYPTAKLAAIAYNNAAIVHFGEFANLNNI